MGGFQQQRVAKPQPSTDCLWRNKDLGRCRCETEAACTCECDAVAHTCTFVTACTRGVHGCVCTCAPAGCIKAWKCAVERVLHLVLERIISQRWESPRVALEGHSQGEREIEVAPMDPKPPTSVMSLPLASAAQSRF